MIFRNAHGRASLGEPFSVQGLIFRGVTPAFSCLFFGRQVAVGTSQPQTSRKMAPGTEKDPTSICKDSDYVCLHIVNILVFIYIYIQYTAYISTGQLVVY